MTYRERTKKRRRIRLRLLLLKNKPLSGSSQGEEFKKSHRKGDAK